MKYRVNERVFSGPRRRSGDVSGWGEAIVFLLIGLIFAIGTAALTVWLQVGGAP